MHCQVAQSHGDSKMWWNSGIVIVKCGGTEWHSVAVTVMSGTTVEQWQSRCHSNNKVWWNSVTVIVKFSGKVALVSQVHRRSLVIRCLRNNFI